MTLFEALYLDRKYDCRPAVRQRHSPVLRHSAGAPQMKLTERPVPGGGRRPFLTFICRGPNLHMVQDLPVSRPHAPAEVDALLLSHKGGGTDSQGALCPLYLDLLPMAPRLLARVNQRTATPYMSSMTLFGSVRAVHAQHMACLSSKF